jgi:hypothetical protein
MSSTAISLSRSATASNSRRRTPQIGFTSSSSLTPTLSNNHPIGFRSPSILPSIYPSPIATPNPYASILYIRSPLPNDGDLTFCDTLFNAKRDDITFPREIPEDGENYTLETSAEEEVWVGEEFKNNLTETEEKWTDIIYEQGEIEQGDQVMKLEPKIRNVQENQGNR